MALLQRSFTQSGNPHTLAEKQSWAEEMLADQYLEIPLTEWQPCHFTYLVHNYFDKQKSIPQILNKMFSKPKNQVFSFSPSDSILNHKVELITSYFELMTITQDLNVCTAVREDLVEGFLVGTHLRWRVINDHDETVAVIGFLYQTSNFKRKKTFKGQNFEVYALGRNHLYLDDAKTLEAKVFNRFITKHGSEIAQSLDLLSAQTLCAKNRHLK